MVSVGQTLAQSPHWVHTFTLYTPGAGKCGAITKAAFLGLVSPNKFREQATRQALHPEHLVLSTYSRIYFSFFELSNKYKVY
jgi:hypothetical protein